MSVYVTSNVSYTHISQGITLISHKLMDEPLMEVRLTFFSTFSAVYLIFCGDSDLHFRQRGL
jgi:hypothetical protein